MVPMVSTGLVHGSFLLCILYSMVLWLMPYPKYTANPIAIQMPNRYQVFTSRLHMRYRLMNVLIAGTHGTRGTLKDNFFLDSGWRAMTMRLAILRMPMMTMAVMAPGFPLANCSLRVTSKMSRVSTNTQKHMIAFVTREAVRSVGLVKPLVLKSWWR